MKRVVGIGIALVASLSLLIGGCGDDEDGAEPSPTVEPTDATAPAPEAAISHLPVPQHPYLAPNGQSNMHADAYMTDTYEVGGPLGVNPEVIRQSYSEGPNLSVTVTFDNKGRILTVNARVGVFYILLLDPETLEEIAAYELPPRDPTDPLFPYNDTSGGAYFVLDDQGRILVADAENAIQVLKYDDAKGDFELVRKYDLSSATVAMEPPARDHVQMIIPEWSGDLWWFVTRYGNVGTLEPESGEIKTIELTGEEMQNSFAVGEDGVYIITDHAMYRFNADDDGVPVADWRTEYDRGPSIKPGMINHGSGTTPQIFGDMVAIADNADPRMNILFLTRSDGEEVCRVPVFGEGESTTENALPGIVREGPDGLEYSVIVENNYGKNSEKLLHPDGPCSESVGGVTRIDMLPDGDGGYTCEEVWTSAENSCSTVPKVSLENGLLYLHTHELLPNGEYAWRLAGVDFETGETAFSIPTGTGLEFTDFGAPITLSPDGETIYLGTAGGMTRIRDGSP